MSKTYFTLVSNRSRDTESLKAFSDRCRRVCRVPALFLDRDRCACDVCPACVLKADRLNAFDLVVNIQSGILCDLLSLFKRSDAIAV